MSAPVAVAIVSHDSAADLPACLAAVGRLDPAPEAVAIVDCASSDASARVARESWPEGISGQVVELEENRGFAAGTNRAIRLTDSPWILTLNPDAAPAADYLERLLERADAVPGGRVGALTGRLLRLGEPRVLDACGMRLTRSWRHLDRGSGELDRGQYRRAERVFGVTGAASLWRRAALVDVAIASEVFDERFHTYREDAELCFRLQERGWEAVFEPTAEARHRRYVVPRRRRSLPREVNYHSLKNRYLLRCGHQSASNWVRTLPWTLARDLGAFLWVLAVERSSLGAYAWLWHRRREIRQHRLLLRARRTAPAEVIERWLRREGEPL